jgi:hypothetical protein
MFSRRELLAASAMGAAIGVSATKAGSFGNPDEPPQGAINANCPGNLVDPGPQNAGRTPEPAAERFHARMDIVARTSAA